MGFHLPVLNPSLDRRQLIFLGAAVGIAACGGTTDLMLPDGGEEDVGDLVEDVGEDAGYDAGYDAGRDAGRDAGVIARDSGTDTGAVLRDSGTDTGAVLRDSGTVLRDTGTDTGTVLRDAGMDTGTVLRDSGTDTGTVLRDAGTDTGPTCTPRGTMVSTVAAFAVGTWRVMGRTSTTVIVGRDAAGFFAFVGVCPHQGCALGAPVAGNITCPCHGARFDANGTVTRGPARTSLPHREVTVCNRIVYLGTATVAASARTPA